MTMNLRRYRARVTVTVFMLTVVRLWGCNGDTVSQPAKGGGGFHNPQPCVGEAINSAWANARLQATFILPTGGQPGNCPYVVALQDTPVNISVDLTAPFSTLLNNGAYQTSHFAGFYSIYTNSLGSHMYAGGLNDCPWTEDFNVPDGSGGVCELSGNVFLGHYGFNSNGLPDPQSVPVDTGAASTATTNGEALGRLQLSGTAENISGIVQFKPGTIFGNTSITTADLPTWRAQTAVDTNSYRYAWMIDGSGVSHNDAQFATSLSPGSHTIRALATLVDNTVDTLSLSVYSTFVTTISGPGSVPPYTSFQWSASAPGGNQPYTYQWTVNGTIVGSGATYSTSFGPSQVHTIGLRVTDAQGFVATSSIQVASTASTGGGGTCLRLPCP